MREIARTYEVTPDPQAAGSYVITCRLCQTTSAHPGDVAELYCAVCDYFHEDPVAQGPRPRTRRRAREEQARMGDMSYVEIARSAYGSYVSNVVGRNHMGLPLPSWHDLPRHRQIAWEVAVRQVEICLLTPEEAARHETQWVGWTPEGRAE